MRTHAHTNKSRYAIRIANYQLAPEENANKEVTPLVPVINFAFTRENFSIVFKNCIALVPG